VHLLREMFPDNDRRGCVIRNRAPARGPAWGADRYTLDGMLSFIFIYKSSMLPFLLTLAAVGLLHIEPGGALAFVAPAPARLAASAAVAARAHRPTGCAQERHGAATRL
jgi:hypothetical protein